MTLAAQTVQPSTGKKCIHQNDAFCGMAMNCHLANWYCKSAITIPAKKLPKLASRFVGARHASPKTTSPTQTLQQELVINHSHPHQQQQNGCYRASHTP